MQRTGHGKNRITAALIAVLLSLVLTAGTGLSFVYAEDNEGGASGTETPAVTEGEAAPAETETPSEPAVTPAQPAVTPAKPAAKPAGLPARVKRKSVTAAMTPLRRNGSPVNWHKLLPARYRNRYRIMQGGTAGTRYLYFAFEDNTVKNGKVVILKVNATTFKRVKVSRPLALDHANDMTYNPDTKQLLVVHCDHRPMRISFVDPGTLKITGYKNIKIPAKLPGATAKQLRNIKYIAGITYNRRTKQYALRIGGIPHLLICDRNLKPVRYIATPADGSERQQSLFSDTNYIYLGRDCVGKYNLISVYKWDGTYVKTIRIREKYELQNITSHNGRLLVTFYNGRYEKSGRRRKYVRSSYTYRITNKVI